MPIDLPNATRRNIRSAVIAPRGFQSVMLCALVMATLTVLTIGCAGHRALADRSELDSAISLYIEGRYEAAVDALYPLVTELEDDSDILAAYLYLGRSYEGLGDYVSAADAYSTGRILGGGVQFDEHLRIVQGHLRAAPRAIETRKVITRGQLAALLVGYTGVDDAAPIGASDMDGHWSKEYAEALTRRGIMEVMPDGRFHPDNAVTRAALYIIALRAYGVMEVDRARLDMWFPGGYEGAVKSGNERVTGGETIDILSALAPSGNE